jgi:ArsR family transcriptional regulator, arsenate/arsenite/antimonite-responsive transcriptional repressor / arsenate reductase (thioredoxin)
MPTPPDVLALLAEPLRWRLVVELGRCDRRVGELVDLVAKPQNLVSYHLGELRSAGIVTARRSAADGRDVYYSADPVRCGDLLADAAGSIHPALDRHAAPPRRRARVLFLCTGNSARSQIAAALAEQRSGRRIAARSAGSHPKPLHPEAVRVLAERGIDIAGRATTSMTRFARTHFDRVVTLCDKVREVCPEFPGDPTAVHWSMSDPTVADDQVTAFDRAAADIERRVELLVAELVGSPDPPG